ncbi:hypothetical protein GQ54DRAFT_181384 [Martensiomyces pterosporus]|nr:hypothetical protein GQ54DRAFT_181384 [Martensiomyces pterosporus]
MANTSASLLSSTSCQRGLKGIAGKNTFAFLCIVCGRACAGLGAAHLPNNTPLCFVCAWNAKGGPAGAFFCGWWLMSRPPFSYMAPILAVCKREREVLPAKA